MTIFNNGFVKIRTIDDEQVTFVVNVHRLKVYHKPISKQVFIQYLAHQSDLKLVFSIYKNNSEYLKKGSYFVSFASSWKCWFFYKWILWNIPDLIKFLKYFQNMFTSYAGIFTFCFNQKMKGNTFIIYLETYCIHSYKTYSSLFIRIFYHLFLSQEV